jgi:hypothetical protein
MIPFRMRFMKKSCCVLISLCYGWSGSVHAEIYKSVDSEGHVTYSSMPSKGAKKLGLDKLGPTSSTPHEHASRASRTQDFASPTDFPKVDSGTQKNRDSTRRKILSDELATEEKILSEARANLKQGDASLSGRKLHELQEEVTLHVKNVSALKTELSNVK